jgi:hypothetical protein
VNDEDQGDDECDDVGGVGSGGGGGEDLFALVTVERTE